MSTDMGMMLLDLVCTVWEGILVVYLAHTFAEKNLKRDGLYLLCHVGIVEAMTFFTTNIFLKFMVQLVLLVVVLTVCYQEKILDMLFALTLFMVFMISSEVILITLSLSLHLPVYYGGIETIFYNWYGYFAIHIVATILSVFGRRKVQQLKRDISIQEEVFLCIVQIGIVNLLVGVNIFEESTINFYKSALFIGCVVVVFALLSMMVYVHKNAAVRLAKERDEHQLKELQTRYQYYEELRKEEARVRAIYHDMKNHLLVLESQGKDSAENQEMIQSLQRQISDYENYVQTGNAFLDVILRDKMKTAREQKTDFHAEIDFTKGDFMDGMDVSTIFGNALDNALEACAKLPEEERFLTVRGNANQGNYLTIQIENAANPADFEENNITTKDDSFLHGFGKKNIRKAVEKYNGNCTWEYGDGIYRLSIAIPIP